MKKATSLLLQHMLDRIKNLEDELHTVIINSTNQFAKMSEQIAQLNTSIGSRFNESGLSAESSLSMLLELCMDASRFSSPC